MERLTTRDKKGRAYFDDDGVLIRGANGTFHQKKDMTAHYIHQRFVVLDKAIDRLAAYEDTGLTPEEIMALLDPPNLPLTLEELRAMDGEPVWLKDGRCFIINGDLGYENNGLYTSLSILADIGLYRRKPEEV